MASASLIVRIDPVIHMLGFLAAYERGYFRDAGLEITLYRIHTEQDLPGDLYDQLTAGAIDVAGTGVTIAHLEAARDRKDFKTVATRGEFTSATSAWSLVARKDLYDAGRIRGTRDLAGKKVGMPGLVGVPAYPYFFLVHDLAREGMNVKEIAEVVPGKSMEIVDLLAKRRLDAAWLQTGFYNAAIAQGHAVLIKHDHDVVSRELPLGVISYSGKLIRERRDVGVKFMEVFVRCVEVLRQPDPTEMGRLANKYYALPADVVAGMVGTRDWPFIPPGCRIDMRRFAAFQRENVELGIVKGTPTPVEDWVDLSFVDEVAQGRR